MDSFVMGKTGFGETMAPRSSDCFIALRMHVRPKASGTNKEWDRFGGKNNQQIRRRIRTWAHAVRCQRAKAANAHLSPFDTAVEVDPDLGVLPDTRCGLCAYERLAALADDDGKGKPTSPMFRCPVPHAKFSFEKGAVPMKRKADGSFDGSGWFTEKSTPPSKYQKIYKTWGKQINVRRRRIDKKAHLLRTELFRPHSDRHGCVLNLKRLGVPAQKGSVHCCMSQHMWDTVYGLEDGEVVGAELTPQVVGCGNGTGTGTLAVGPV